MWAEHVARGVPDGRRQRFIREMIVGLVIAGHVHLTKIARAIGLGLNNVHADEKRLSRHLDSEHWSMRPVIDGLLHDSAAMVGEESLIVADLTDIAKYYARHLEGLGRVRDASDPEKRTAPGYWGVEDATWGIQQRFHLEEFLVHSWRSIRRLIYLVAIAFCWLNLWGKDSYTPLRDAFINHPWRLPKKVIYLFDWLATQISRFLHPKPKILPTGYFNTG